MKSFCWSYSLTNLIKKPTCYKNPINRTCTDLFLTNVPQSFNSTYLVETEPTHFHLVTMTVTRISFKKFQSNTSNYRSYKNFSNDAFRKNLIIKLSNKNLVNKDKYFQRFCDISLETLNKHDPFKKKHARGNQMSFFNKELSKAIMTRTKLTKLLSHKIGVTKIECVIQNKETFVSRS